MIWTPNRDLVSPKLLFMPRIETTEFSQREGDREKETETQREGKRNKERERDSERGKEKQRKRERETQRDWKRKREMEIEREGKRENLCQFVGCPAERMIIQFVLVVYLFVCLLFTSGTAGA